MRIYFSGIGGVGIGPLAQIAKQAGHDVLGSDIAESQMFHALEAAGIPVILGQTGDEIAAAQTDAPIDWFVMSSSLPEDHPELLFAKEHNIRISKRDELLNEIITKSGQKLIAVAGTHGKTTTTAMIVWLFKKLGLPLSYSIGTTINFGPSGQFDPNATYFVYEADEYDRNMLHFHPDITALVSIDYDHNDTYPTAYDYLAAFRLFVAQSQFTYLWKRDQSYADIVPAKNIEQVDSLDLPAKIVLAGEHNRRNATLAIQITHSTSKVDLSRLIAAINEFPGTQRRFEKLANNLYTDYAHHPVEIAATLQLASELSEKIVVIYQPHQNIRQHEVIDQYKDCFNKAKQVYWLPTYLSREDHRLLVIPPKELIRQLSNPSIAEPAELNDTLIQNIKSALAKGYLVIGMGAGNIDTWLRQHLSDFTV